jgi:hypothetical protein
VSKDGLFMNKEVEDALKAIAKGIEREIYGFDGFGKPVHGESDQLTWSAILKRVKENPAEVKNLSEREAQLLINHLTNVEKSLQSAEERVVDMAHKISLERNLREKEQKAYRMALKTRSISDFEKHLNSVDEFGGNISTDEA